MVTLRVLALLPTLTPPAHLQALAAQGHDVHLVATRPGPTSGYMQGVRVWSTGFWWQAWQHGQPHILLTQTDDPPGRRLAHRMGRTPVITVPAEPALTAAELTQALLAAIPDRVRAAAAPAAMDVTAPDGVHVVAWCHYGLPYRRAGSEAMLHNLLRALRQAGLGVLAITSEMPEAPPSWEWDGIEYRQLPHGSADMLIRRLNPPVLVTHHHLAPNAIRLAKDIGARSALIVHNDHTGHAEFLRAEPDLVVYNSDWVLQSLRPRCPQTGRIPRLVVHPPVDPAEHHTASGDMVTLVNLSVHKGVNTWRAVAGLLPELPFLGVMGAHGPQTPQPVPANARIIGQTSDMRADVWARTRVLLMPSVYESYGMAAVEALASGLPVIAHPTPGLVEALGDAATFIDRDDHTAWADAVRGLHRGGRRRGAAQKAARERSAFLADRTSAELQRWVQAVQELAARTPVAS